MNKFWHWITKPTFVVIDKIGFCYYHLLSKEDQEYVTLLINKGENVTICSDGHFLHLYTMDLMPLPAFSGATLKFYNE